MKGLINSTQNSRYRDWYQRLGAFINVGFKTMGGLERSG